MKKHIRLILCFIALSATTTAALSCSCINLDTSLIQNYNHSSLIVKATIVSKVIEKLSDSINSIPVRQYKYRAYVSYVYKGKISGDTLEFFSGLGNGDCGYPFAVGQQYLIYFSKSAKKKNHNSAQLNATICSRTRLFDQVEDERLKRLE